jgi:C-terminal processing protease CtpA/Prc
MSTQRFLRSAFLLLLSALFTANGEIRAQQKMDSINQERAKEMLREAYDHVKKNYFDTKFHGLDWDAHYREFQERMKAATSLGQAFAVVAGFLDALNDSHTFFRPPARPVRMDYGFRLQYFGDKAFITRIRPKTDAEAKVHVGDEVVIFNRYNVTRADLWKMNYYFGQISPRAASELSLRALNGQQRNAVVDAKVQERKRVLDVSGGNGDDDLWQLIREEENADHLVRQRYIEIGDVMIWMMPEFVLTDEEVDHLFGIAKKHKSLILDLRSNPGGYVKTLERAVGSVMDHDVKIADRIGRKELKPQLAKTRGNSIYTGKIIVLVDSNSASAAELFARVMQLEQRGTVIGDRSSGSAMESKGYSDSQGTDTKIFYSFSITDADLIMKDGKSLEHNGVVPDEIVLPTATDLAEGRDPALAHAAELAGLKIDPSAAGKMFPFEWQPF